MNNIKLLNQLFQFLFHRIVQQIAPNQYVAVLQTIENIVQIVGRRRYGRSC
jgi:hypothetical protein